MEDEFIWFIGVLLVLAAVVWLVYTLSTAATKERPTIVTTHSQRPRNVVPTIEQDAAGATDITEQIEPDVGIKVRLAVAYPRPYGNLPEVPPTATGDGGWILDAEAPFRLTIYGVSEDQIQEIKTIVESPFRQARDAAERSLLPIVARTNLRCKEIDEYVREFKPKYLARLEELKRLRREEWEKAGELDKQDLLKEFREEALRSLEVRPHCDLETLFECEPRDATIDDILIDRFGYENMVVYLSHISPSDRVLRIPADYRQRATFEKLVELGLAVRGADIPLDVILSGLTLKQMESLVSDLNPPKFTRKAKAMAFLQTVPNLRERLQTHVAFRELFQLKPLPPDLVHINLEEVSSAWRYIAEVSSLLFRTYLYAARERLWRSQSDARVRQWEISTYDPCPHCQRLAQRKYPKNSRPGVPFHVGCKCSVLAKYDDEIDGLVSGPSPDMTPEKFADLQREGLVPPGVKPIFGPPKD